MSAITYYLSNTNGLTSSLKVQQTPPCGYSASDWAVVTTGTTGTEPANFGSITSAGDYTISPTSTITQQGYYDVTLSSVTVNAVVYDGSALRQTLASPSKFVLKVVSRC